MLYCAVTEDISWSERAAPVCISVRVAEGARCGPLRKWRSQNSGAFPSDKDVDAVVALFDKTSEDKSEEVCRDLARTSAGDLSPMAAFLGGVAGQEVLKACTGKFAPVRMQRPRFASTA